MKNKMLQEYLYILSLILVSNLISGQELNFEDVQYEVKAEFCAHDAQIYGYEVSPNAFIRASAVLTFKDSLSGDLVFFLHGEIRIDSIIINNKTVKYFSEKVAYYYDYSYLALKTTIEKKYLDSEVNIFYSGFFNPSKARALSDFMKVDINQGIFLRGYGYSPWFPILSNGNDQNYKANFKRIEIVTPYNFKTVVSGKLLAEYKYENTNVSVWQPGLMDAADIQCVSSNYLVNSKDNILIYYFDASSEKSSQEILEFVQDLRVIYTNNFRKLDSSTPIYIVEMPKYGDISSSNVVGIQEQRFRDFSNINTKLTIAHELAHPYVKIPVAEENPFYVLVVEGFPSFFQVYVLSKIMDVEEFNIAEHMKKREAGYINKRATGLNKRGRKIPVEKPILEINAKEIGVYKDNFVLPDRVWLFLYYIWNNMGNEKFDIFISELFNRDSINYDSFESLVLKYLPDSKNDIFIWLKTTEFPARFKIGGK